MIIETFCRSKNKQSFIGAIAELYRIRLKLAKSKWSVIITTTKNFRKSTGMNGAIQLIGDNQLSITLDSRLSMDELILTLAHEFIHVKQFAKGQLKNKVDQEGNHYQVWMGRRCQSVSYYDHPHEIDAFRRERLLANEVAKIFVVKKQQG